MYIEKLLLTSFRNYASLEFSPGPELNILYGPNGQGKSGILEAVYLLATTKSHRTSRDAEMIRLGDDMARVSGEFKRSARNDVVLDVVLSRTEKKTVKVNTVKHSRVGELVGELNAVIFSTSDIDMVKGEPARRRRFLNLEISQLSPQYVYALGRYKRALEQRNKLLRDIANGSIGRDELTLWDRQLATYGSGLIKRRGGFISELAESAAAIYGSLTDSSERLTIAYEQSVQADINEPEESIAESLASALLSRRDADIARATTSAGPHRDDMSIEIDGISAREYASQGQQRTAAIAIKLSEIEVMAGQAKEEPVVLLDDILAELDETRRSQVLRMTVGRCQTLLTTAHLEEVEKATRESAACYLVSGGQVIRT